MGWFDCRVCLAVVGFVCCGFVDGIYKIKVVFKKYVYFIIIFNGCYYSVWMGFCVKSE